MIPPNPSPSQPFTPLPSETTLYTSPARTSLAIASIGKFPADQPVSYSSSSGTLYLTTKRLIYLPSPPTAALQSFSSPLLNLQDTHVTTPWIGPNVWTALLRPVSGGHLDKHPALEVRLTFRDGGAYDFQIAFERLRERVAQALESARARAQDGSGRHGRGPGPMDGVEVVMEDLPRYEAAREITTNEERSGTAGTGETSQPAFAPPDEPPGTKGLSSPARRLTDTRLHGDDEQGESR